MAREVEAADEEAEAHREAADAALRLEASRHLEDDGGIELASGEPTETAAQQESVEASAYAEEVTAERVEGPRRGGRERRRRRRFGDDEDE